MLNYQKVIGGYMKSNHPKNREIYPIRHNPKNTWGWWRRGIADDTYASQKKNANNKNHHPNANIQLYTLW